MTKLLTEVMRKVVQLPQHRQDDAARMLMTMLENDAKPYRLSYEQLQEVEVALAQADAGEFASDADVRELLAYPWA